MNIDDTLVIPGNGSLTTTPRSKAELAEQMYPGLTYDCSLPQWWVDDVQGLGFCEHPAGIFVWGYAEGDTMGAPWPLTVEAVQVLTKIARFL